MTAASNSAPVNPALTGAVRFSAVITCAVKDIRTFLSPSQAGEHVRRHPPAASVVCITVSIEYFCGVTADLRVCKCSPRERPRPDRQARRYRWPRYPPPRSQQASKDAAPPRSPPASPAWSTRASSHPATGFRLFTISLPSSG
ncbi:hypothetical protein SDC9_169721 [bioreactor metagenome]|uniref:Uncharacterized protein n=1 Tax=bioreactor metagenome TaxID=1076179 RepID=A0A645G630_9ZZZZ